MPQPSPLAAAQHHAQALAATGDLAGARLTLQQALDGGRAAFGDDDPAVLATAHQLAVVHQQADDPSAARRVLEEAFAAGQWKLGDADPLMLAISFDIGVVAEELGNRHEARRAFGRVAAVGPPVLGEDHWAVLRARAYLGEDPPTVRLELPVPPVQPSPRPEPAPVPPSPPPPAPPVPPMPRQQSAPPAAWPDRSVRRDDSGPAGAPPDRARPEPIGQQQGQWERTRPEHAPPEHAWQHQARQAQDREPSLSPLRQDRGRPDQGRQDQARPDQGRPNQGWPDHGRPDQGPQDPGRQDLVVRPEHAPVPRFGPAPLVADERPLPAYPRRGGTGRGPAVFAAIAAALAAVIAVVALIVVLANRDGAGADVPTLGGGRPPSDVRLRDTGATMRVTWSDPTDGTVSFMVTGAHSGEPLTLMGRVGPGQTQLTLNGLNAELDYCFAVVAVYGEGKLNTSPTTCTARSRAEPDISPTQ